MTPIPGRYGREVQVACRAVRDASALCLAVLDELSIHPVRKKDTSPVTVADFGSQALICRALSAAFPDDPVIAEESSALLTRDESAPLADTIVRHVRAQVPDATIGQVVAWIDRGTHADHAVRFWALDPVDGTKGFLRGAQFAVALALIEEGRPVLSAVACPHLRLGADEGVVAFAVSGAGAWYTPIAGDTEPVPLRVRDTSDPSKARYCESVEHTHSSHEEAARLADRLGVAEPPLRMDSQAKYAVVAHGDADFYLRLPAARRYVENIWDHAAGCLLVEEAGGRVTDIHGHPLDFGHGRHLVRNRGILASNGRLHDEIVAALADQFGGRRR